MTHIPQHNANQINIREDEKVQLIVRKHWVIFLKDILGILLLAILPILLFGGMLSGGTSTAIVGFFMALWILIVWVAGFTIWTNYYLDIWIVTDKRIINVDQIALFNREVTTLRIERVQDVTISTEGLLETLFKFGTIRVQSASSTNKYSMIRGIKDPTYVKNIIMEHVDMATDHTSKIKYNTEIKPTHSA